jgi:hypothetical protein
MSTNILAYLGYILVDKEVFATCLKREISIFFSILKLFRNLSASTLPNSYPSAMILG